MSSLDKLVLNNFIVKNRDVIRQGKTHIVNRIYNRSRELRNIKTDNDLKKGKNCRRADKYIEEIQALRKFHLDDITKFALLNKKAILEVSNDEKSTLDERILCRVASHSAVASAIEKFRDQYPDWEQKVPLLLKTMGLQYRKKRLMKLDMKGRKETFLEKEHNTTCVLQQLTDLEVDRRLLAKASDMIKEAKENESKSKSDPGKSKRKDQSQSLYEEHCLEPTNSSLNVNDRTEKISSKKPSKEDKNSAKKELESRKNIKKAISSEIENNSEENGNSNEECITHDNEITDKTVVVSKKKVKKLESVSSENKRILAESPVGIKSEIKKEPESDGWKDEGISEGDSSSEAEEGLRIKDIFIKKEETGTPDDGEDLESRERTGDELDGSDQDEEEGEDDYEDKDSDDADIGSEEDDEKEYNTDESESEESSSKKKKGRTSSSVAKKKGKLETKMKSRKRSLSNDEGSGMSDAEGSEEFDSEGSIIDEDYVGEEITSIWDDFKMQDEAKPHSKSSKLLPNNKEDKFSGSDIVKSKGTVEIRRLNLTDKKSVNNLLEAQKGGSSGTSSDSEEEEEDFFVRAPDPEKRKNSMKSVDEEMADTDNEESEDMDESGADARERFIDKSFKKIWGRGMDETITVSRGRRGGPFRGVEGRNRGRGFGGSRGRGFGNENANYIPLGNSSQQDQDFGFYNNNNNNNTENKFMSDFKCGFPRGGRGRGRDERGRPGPKRGRFDNSGYNNSNFAPVTGSRDSNFSLGNNSSLLHPSWMAKLKDKEKASSIYDFKGQVKKFDFDNSNNVPVTDSPDNNFSRRNSGSSLHPSWAAKQNEKEKASISQFKGQVRRFDGSNDAPVRGNRDSTFSHRNNSHSLHPSWAAKQNEKEKASISQFKGQVKRFDDSNDAPVTGNRGNNFHHNNTGNRGNNFQHNNNPSVHPSWAAKQNLKEKASISQFKGQVKTFDFDD